MIFPKSYINFLKEFGEGGISGTYIFGIDDADYSSILYKTNKYRVSEELPEHYIVIERRGIAEEWLICLDTSRMKDEECPDIRYVIGAGEVTEYAKDFDEVFDKLVEVCK